MLLPPDYSTRLGRSGDRRVLRYRQRTLCIANAHHARRDCSAQVLRLQRVSNPRWDLASDLFAHPVMRWDL